MGRISSMPPSVHTGNLDNKDVMAGTTLYLPVYAAGALFSVGDAHAAQGQGEVDLSAIETGNRGRFQLIVGKDMKLTWPRAETATHWIVMGLNPNLEEAMKMAVRETISFIVDCEGSRYPPRTTSRDQRCVGWLRAPTDCEMGKREACQPDFLEFFSRNSLRWKYRLNLTKRVGRQSKTGRRHASKRSDPAFLEKNSRNSAAACPIC
jgi:hypothetical protein